MSYSHYDRLSALDSAFLEIEDGNAHMHIGAVGVFETGPLASASGGLDFDRIVDFIGTAVQKNDRFQQKLAYVPGTSWPVWVDDARFNLRYHVRHTCLPSPGDERVLKRLTGRVMSEELDRGKPLWELWFVEGVEGGRFAVISKVHHAMADGVSGVDLLAAVMGPDPDFRPERSAAWRPRPAPSSERLAIDELTRIARVPFSFVNAGLRALAHPLDALGSAFEGVAGLGESLRSAMNPASETAFNQPLGPHRRFDWASLEIGEIREIRKQLGGTLNDVVLTLVTGAVRRHFGARGLPLFDLDFRVMVPVNVRSREEQGELGNKVSMLVVPLPIEDGDLRSRHARVCEATQAAKESSQRASGEALAEIADLTGSSLLTQLVRAGLQSRVANLVVTNVPGPPKSVYLLGAKLLHVYPVVPLAINQALGIALFSYNGTLHWGFNADWDQLPDLHEIVGFLEEEFDELRSVCGREPRAVAVS